MPWKQPPNCNADATGITLFSPHTGQFWKVFQTFWHALCWQRTIEVSNTSTIPVSESRIALPQAGLSRDPSHWGLHVSSFGARIIACKTLRYFPMSTSSGVSTCGSTEQLDRTFQLLLKMRRNYWLLPEHPRGPGWPQWLLRRQSWTMRIDNQE